MPGLESAPVMIRTERGKRIRTGKAWLDAETLEIERLRDYVLLEIDRELAWVLSDEVPALE
jgi:hypothetical protein